jgi:hypothetical protein
MASRYLDKIVFEVRYAFGHTYLDRCGQTLVDIERGVPGWIPGEVDVQRGVVFHATNGYTITFHSSAFNFNATSSEDPQHLKNLEDIGEQLDAVWKIVSSNLGIREFVRMGARFFYLVPTNSMEESERVIERSGLQLTTTGLDDYKLMRRNLVGVFSKDSVEYRVGLSGITRTSAQQAPPILTTLPHLLPRHQREAQIEMLKARTRYRKDPRHAASFDVDCVIFDPPSVSPSSYLVEQSRIVADDFVRSLLR